MSDCAHRTIAFTKIEPSLSCTHSTRSKLWAGDRVATASAAANMDVALARLAAVTDALAAQELAVRRLRDETTSILLLLHDSRSEHPKASHVHVQSPAENLPQSPPSANFGQQELLTTGEPVKALSPITSASDFGIDDDDVVGSEEPSSNSREGSNDEQNILSNEPSALPAITARIRDVTDQNIPLNVFGTMDTLRRQVAASGSSLSGSLRHQVISVKRKGAKGADWAAHASANLRRRGTGGSGTSTDDAIGNASVKNLSPMATILKSHQSSDSGESVDTQEPNLRYSFTAGQDMAAVGAQGVSSGQEAKLCSEQLNISAMSMSSSPDKRRTMSRKSATSGDVALCESDKFNDDAQVDHSMISIPIMEDEDEPIKGSIRSQSSMTKSRKTSGTKISLPSAAPRLSRRNSRQSSTQLKGDKGDSSNSSGVKATAVLEPSSPTCDTSTTFSIYAYVRKIIVTATVEFVFTPMYDEWKENFNGSAERQYWVDQICKKLLTGIHPLSAFVVYWKFLMSLCQVFALAAIPVVASFTSLDIHIKNFIMTFISAFYFCDILVKFNTLSLVDVTNTLTTDTLAESRKKYFFSSFFLDVMAFIPYSEIARSFLGDGSDYLALIQLIGVRNLHIIFQTNPIHHALAKKIQQVLSVGSSFMSIFLFGGLLVAFLHLHACFIFLIGRATSYEDGFWLQQTSILSKGTYTQYIWALFISMANTFPMTGYVPVGPLEQTFTILTVIVGAILYAALVGVISSFSLGLDSSGRKFKDLMDEVNEYMEHTKLTEDARRKVRQMYNLKYHGKYFNQDAIMGELNFSLQKEITVQTYRGLISKVPFLRRETGDGRDEDFLIRVCLAMQPEFFIAGDTIVTAGEEGSEMYFIEKGTVQIIVNGNIVGGLRDGAFFGEVALLDKTPRSATIRASSHTKVYRLSREDMESILEDFPDMALVMRRVYEERLEKIRLEKLAKLQKEMSEKATPIQQSNTQ